MTTGGRNRLKADKPQAMVAPLFFYKKRPGQFIQPDLEVKMEWEKKAEAYRTSIIANLIGMSTVF